MCLVWAKITDYWIALAFLEFYIMHFSTGGKKKSHYIAISSPLIVTSVLIYLDLLLLQQSVLLAAHENKRYK